MNYSKLITLDVVNFSKLVFILVALLILQACSTNPVTGRSELALSEAWEAKVGPQYHQQIMKEYQVYDDPELQAYINEIGQKLAAASERPDIKWTFTLLDSPQVNAFAIPGGYVYVTRGIMAYMNSEAQLAGVIGHEIGHVTARHGARRAAQQQVSGVASAVVAIGTGSGELTQLSQTLGGALMSGYGRKQELESDELGAKYIAQNNYAPEEMIDVIGILKDQELFNRAKAKREGRQPQAYHGLFASHPRNDERLQTAIKAAELYRKSSQPRLDSGRFDRLTDGMVFGESESQGITRGNNFYHKALNLFIGFPQGWRIINKPNELIGVAANGSEIVRMRMGGNSSDDIGDYARKSFQSFSNGQRISLSNGEAYAGLSVITDPRTQQQQRMRASAVQIGDKRFLLLGQGKSNVPDQSFFSTLKSMRGLSRNEQNLATESRINRVIIHSGDTFARLARQSTLSDYAEDQLRLINNRYPDGEPVVGSKIKIIE